METGPQWWETWILSVSGIKILTAQQLLVQTRQTYVSNLYTCHGFLSRIFKAWLYSDLTGFKAVLLAWDHKAVQYKMWYMIVAVIYDFAALVDKEFLMCRKLATISFNTWHSFFNMFFKGEGGVQDDTQVFKFSDIFNHLTTYIDVRAFGFVCFRRTSTQFSLCSA